MKKVIICGLIEPNNMGKEIFEELENEVNQVLGYLPIDRGLVNDLIDKAKEKMNQKFEELKDFDTWKEWKNKK
jgi:ABC-type uncharacterized transport system ATPase subunit